MYVFVEYNILISCSYCLLIFTTFFVWLRPIGHVPCFILAPVAILVYNIIVENIRCPTCMYSLNIILISCSYCLLIFTTFFVWLRPIGPVPGSILAPVAIPVSNIIVENIRDSSSNINKRNQEDDTPPLSYVSIGSGAQPKYAFWLPITGL